MSNLETVMQNNGITIETQFVPFMQSRNAADVPTSKRSLNWRVTLLKNGKRVLSTDYSAGIGHCPSYKQGARWTLDYDALIVHETETGTTARPMHGIGFVSKGQKIEPKAADVVYSLISDAGVLDYSSFEDWASEYGYETDSRSAEKTYRACLEIALQLRNGIGNDALVELQSALQDY